MAHTSEGAKDAWRIPKPHSGGNDTGAGADAQPYETRVGPFRAYGDIRCRGKSQRIIS